MTSTFHKHQHRRGKALSVRTKLRGVTDRPRLSVFRSLSSITAQIIDDVRGHTLVAASSQEKDLKTSIKGLRKTDVAKKIGSLVAERAKRAGVSKVCFDRGAYKYHGRIKALADAAREAGLEF
ncbi:MAG: 50S ribosomal protein L18 [Planctomycetes bacterium]|jgi:large subunit ribosomal protein L18|nr:50S ribosomal protein L18 [Planctomycetota bacterium]